VCKLCHNKSMHKITFSNNIVLRNTRNIWNVQTNVQKVIETPQNACILPYPAQHKQTANWHSVIFIPTCYPWTSKNISFSTIISRFCIVTLLRICGLRNSSAILATLKIMIDTDIDKIFRIYYIICKTASKNWPTLTV